MGENKATQLRLSKINTGGFVESTIDQTGDYVTGTSDGLNREVEIFYDTLTNPAGVYSKGPPPTTGQQITVQPPMFVVASHYSSSGDVSHDSRMGMVYTYSGLKVHRRGRGMLGFAERSATDLNKDITTINTYFQNFPYTGMSRTVETRVDDAALIQRTTSTPAKQTTTTAGGASYHFPYVRMNTESTYALNGGAETSTVTTTQQYSPDGLGNLITLTTTTDNGYGTTAHTKVTVNLYEQENPADWIIGRLTKATVTHQQTGKPDKVRSSSFSYYPASGQIWTETVEPGDANQLVTTYTYDPFGNVVRKSLSGSGLGNRYSTTEYDVRGRFATKLTNALGHSETKQYDKRFGPVTRHTGPNGLSTYAYYDDFARKYLEISQNNVFIDTTYEWCNANATGVNSRYCVTTQGSDGSYKKVYFDQLDRAVRTETRGLGDGGSVMVRTDKQFNLHTGQLDRESIPYYAGDFVHWVEYQYDVLDRPISVKQPELLAPATMQYQGLTTVNTDPLGHATTSINNALGKTARTIDALGNITELDYDPVGNLIETRVSANNSNTAQDAAATATVVTTLEYDKFGNKISMNDPDMGIWRYEYNAAGELTKQTDAGSKFIRMDYDDLGRMVRRFDNTSGTTPTHTWTYDNAPGKGIGKLARVTGPQGYQKTVTYNNRGQVASLAETLPDTTAGSGGTSQYKVLKSYDDLGRLSLVRYPDADPARPVQVRHHYNGNGILVRLTDPRTNQAYWQADWANAQGKITRQTLGNGVVTERSYDINGRLESIDSGLGGSTGLQQLFYSWDDVGNLLTRDDLRQGQSEIFGYDAINRLRTIDTTSTVNGVPYAHPIDEIKYDGHGNITQKDGLVYHYNPARPHAVSQKGTGSYSYGAHGNMTAGDGRGYLWTAFNKPARITKGETLIHLAYNADRSRMLKQVDGGTNWYFGGLYERSRKSDGSETHKFIISDGVQVTQYKSAANQWTAQSTRYLLKDHLGSVDVITDEQGNALNQLSFNAWGQRRTGTWNSFSGSELSALITQLQQDALSKGYTGHEMDDEVGLINMKGRIYDPALGRFLSADPHIQAPGDSQSYNRYSYVKNNPLSYTDPSGYFFKSFNRFMKKYGRVIVAVALAYITAGASLAALGAAAYTTAGVMSFTGAVVAGAAGGFASGLVLTGSLSGAMKGAVFGGLSAGLAYGVGHGGLGLSGYSKHVAHGVAQGGVSTLQGGKFKSGFVAGFASSRFEGPLKDLGDGKAWGRAARTASASVIGGTVSAMTGGKFANGAVTGAFVHLFNAEGGTHKVSKEKSSCTVSSECRQKVISDIREVPRYERPELLSSPSAKLGAAEAGALIVDTQLQLNYRVKYVDTVEYYYYEAKYDVIEWYDYGDYMVGPIQSEAWYPDTSINQNVIHTRREGLAPIEGVPFEQR